MLGCGEMEATGGDLQSSELKATAFGGSVSEASKNV